MGKASKTKNIKNQKHQKPNIKQPKDRFALWVSLGTALVAAIVVTIVVVATINVGNQSNVTASTTTPNGVINDGFVINKDGLVPSEPTPINTTFTQSEYNSTQNNISMYIDYACPHCAEFEDANIDQIETWLNDGTIDTLTIHPIAFLTQYSLDAAAAFSCVANYEPKRILEAHKLLTANYTNALTPAQIAKLFKDNGFNIDENFNKCVRGGEYKNFITAATERAQQGPIPQSTGVNSIAGTPTVLVNGNRYNNAPTDATAFKEFVTTTINQTTQNN